MKRVLFTRTMQETDLKWCEEFGIEPFVHPLIGIEPVEVSEVVNSHADFWEQLQLATAITFTSQHAVHALFGDLPSFREQPTGRNMENPAERILQVLQKKPVYTVGEITADMLDEYGIMARFPEDYNGTVLAEMMLTDGVHTSVVHFCGSVRRPEFKTEMNRAGVEVHQVEVYRKTELLLDSEHEETLSTVEAVAFYSPSAVEAFWNQGLNIRFSGQYYAIGHTTLAALQSRGETATVPRIPTSELLIREIAKTR